MGRGGVPHGGDGTSEAERECVNCSKITGVINDKVGLRFGSLNLYSELGVPPHVSGWSGIKTNLLGVGGFCPHCSLAEVGPLSTHLKFFSSSSSTAFAEFP